ncbi:hypothetical protein AGABI1DRAFT_129705 [Agaricus bisporus var. burnettii JB137-S8]|uniref:Uncharacterized protein n=1 Tax=Agaricus bisporus var. burnettii (strain JB137-S8 / ATCC MYA-4627 / FGSC 10392) TaxID=597362 RepID=K5XSI1_AGABU|nr:uncharacterized protein AGABI1DRAFT_129705 [Agaricus bisporus var. burnettii JB137-S8]EKM77915.1 hypothetical protein AGABI1DRAFT_129705 [Agaricus bisporus var. burnettii JB137-S8]
MNIAENNNSAESYPSPRSQLDAQYATNHFPRHGPTQNAQRNMPPQYTNPSHTHPPYNPTMRPVAEQGSIHYHYHSCQFVLVPYQTGQQPYPYPPPPAQPYFYPSQPGQSYFYFPHSGQQPYYSPPQQSATSAHQYQQGFPNSTVDPQHHQDTEPPPLLDSEDPDVEIRHNLENQAPS